MKLEKILTILAPYFMGCLIAFHLLLDNFLLLEDFKYTNPLKLIMLGCLFIMAFWKGGTLKGKRSIQIILGIYVLLFLQNIILVFFSNNIESSSRGTFVFFVKVLLFFWLMLICFSASGSSLKSASRAWNGMALAFSVQSILLVTLVFIIGAYIPHGLYSFSRISAEPKEMYGLLGFFSSPPRVESFFSEANKFAQFLIFPLFLGVAAERGLIRWFFMVTVGTAFLFTFSFSAFAGVFVGLAIYYFWQFQSRLVRRGITVVTMLGFPLLLFFLTATFFMQPQETNNETVTRLLYKAHSVQDKSDNMTYATQIANNNFFGIGAIQTEEAIEFDYGRRNTASGLFGTLTRTGWWGMAMFLFILAVIGKLMLQTARWVREGIPAQNTLAAGAAFVAMVIANLMHGPFDQRPYLVILAFFLASYEHQKARLLEPLP